MGNVLKLTAENPDELLNAGLYGAGALIRVERSATGGGTGYTEIGTVPIVSGTTLYTYYDQTAAAGSWYRSRFSNSGGSNTSSYSEEFQATIEVQSYCSLYDMKQAIGKSPTDTSDDEEFLQWIGRAAAFIDNKASRSFAPDPSTSYTFDGMNTIEDCRTLWFPTGIRTVSQVQVAPNTGGTFAPIALTDVVLRPLIQDRDPGWPATKITLTDMAAYRRWPRGYGNIIVTGTFGWAKVPSEIEAIALHLAVSGWRGRSSGGGDLFSIGIDGERTFERVLSWEEKETLKSYNADLFVR